MRGSDGTTLVQDMDMDMQLCCIQYPLEGELDILLWKYRQSTLALTS